MSLTCTQKQLCTSVVMSPLVQFSDFITVIAFVSPHIYSTLKAKLAAVSLAEWIDTIFTTEGFFRSSCRKLGLISCRKPKWDLNAQSPSFVQML